MMKYEDTNQAVLLRTREGRTRIFLILVALLQNNGMDATVSHGKGTIAFAFDTVEKGERCVHINQYNNKGRKHRTEQLVKMVIG